MIDGNVGDRVGERLGQVVDDLQFAVGLVELDVHQLGRVQTAKSEALGSRS